MSDKEKVTATITKVLPNDTYEMETEDGKTIKGYVGGKMKKNDIRLIVGDRVDVELDPYGGTGTNRIVWRKNN